MHEYEERMPEIVESIKALNRERLEVYKASMKRWCEGRRSWLEGMMANLTVLEDSVEQMDIDRDMRVLTEGAADFNRLIDVTDPPSQRSPSISTSTSLPPTHRRSGSVPSREQKESSKVSEVLPRVASTSGRPNGQPPMHSKRPSQDISDVNPLSRPSTPIVTSVSSDFPVRADDSRSPSPRPSLTITTTSPPPEPSGKAGEERKEVGPSSSSPAGGKKKFLVSQIEVPSPISAPHGPQVVKREGERGRSLSTASASPSHSQPSSPAAPYSSAAPPSPTVLLSSPSVSPAVSPSPLPPHPPPHHPHHHLPSASMTSFPFRQGSSPRLHQPLHVSHSLSSLSAASPHPSNNASLASTFLSQIKKQHTAEDRRDAQRAVRKAKETVTWKTLTTSSLNDLTPSYALNLWGDFGFEVACQQGTLNKRAMKEMTMELEQWVIAMEAKKKRWEAILLMLPKAISTGTGQGKVWEQMRQRVSLHAKAYADYLGTVYRCITDLKLDKGELKFSVKRYGEHKAKLERELLAASESVSKALAKRSKASQAPPGGGGSAEGAGGGVDESKAVGGQRRRRR